MNTLYFSQHNKKQSPLSRLQEKWVKVSGGKPRLHNFQILGLALIAIMQYMPISTQSYKVTDIPVTLIVPFVTYVMSIGVSALYIQHKRGFFPETLFDNFKQQVFWMSFFQACITFPIILLFLVRTFWGV